MIQMDDVQVCLAKILRHVAAYKANILTIHQSIPVNGVATVTLSVGVGLQTGDVSGLADEIQEMSNVHYVKIQAGE